MCPKVSPKPSLPQAEQLHLSQPVFIAVLQPSDHPPSPPLDLLQQSDILMVGTPDVNTALQQQNQLLDLLATYLVMQSKIQLAFWAESALCQLILSISSCNI